VPQPRKNTSEKFIKNFCQAVPVITDEANRMKTDLGVDFATAVTATLLMHLYGLHLGLKSNAARNLIQNSDVSKFETAMLSNYVEASVKKLGVNESTESLYQEISEYIKAMDSVFYANANDTNGPFEAVTKKFLQLICGMETCDITVMFAISAGIANRMEQTTKLFHALYENGYRY
jgi:hypothetical protein